MRSLNFILYENSEWKGVGSRLDGFIFFPHEKNLDLSKLEGFADHKLNVIQMMEFFFDKVENREKEKQLE